MAWRGHRPEGCLIGNRDMHFGNLSLLVAQSDVMQGRFTLAPVYDMLPMRWRPDAATGAFDLQGPARAVAEVSWHGVAAHAPLSQGFRTLARSMAERVAGHGA